MSNQIQKQKCYICDQLFSIKGISRHIKTHQISLQEYYDSYIEPNIKHNCPICNKAVKFKSLAYGYAKCCSKKCSSAYAFKCANEKYGVQNISQVSQFKEKMKQNIKLSWDNLSESQYVERCKNIAIGTKNSESITNKLHNISLLEKEYNYIHIQKLLDEYGYGWYFAKIVPIYKVPNYSYNFVSNKDINTIITYSFESHTATSIVEIDLRHFIQLYYTNLILYNTKKIIYPYELDIYMPDINIAIEYNGLYYHSIQNNKSPEYHLNKSLLCREKNIRLIHIYEFENIETQKQLLYDLLVNHIDNYPSNDFNKNNLLDAIPEPEIIYQDKYTVYGAGLLNNSC